MNPATTPGPVRPPAVSDLFYPADPGALRRMVRGFLEEVPRGGTAPVAIVAPHAGYVYSGLTAAFAYRDLPRAPADRPRRVFVLSPSHRVYLEGVSVGDYGGYDTPLGVVAIDTETVEALARHPDVSRDTAPHRQEHALEVHLPFLLETVGHLRLVPMVYGGISGGHLADILAGVWRPGDLIVASSDLSHFHDYETASRLDGRCHEAVLARDPRAMRDCEACGNTGITALLELARRQGWRTVMADYRNSGDTAGDKHRVVGYASYLFFDRETRATSDPADPGGLDTLPALLREHLDGALSGRTGLDADILIGRLPGVGRLLENGASFVTLTRDGQLRGCIGTLEPHRPLGADLLENAVSAAIRDPRFPPVRAAELEKLVIEVSILSPPRPLAYTDTADLLKKLQPGVHGVILRHSGRRATFLPQVWAQIPGPERFLSRLCEKAGLGGGCWRQGPEIFVYTVEKITEPQS